MGGERSGRRGWARWSVGMKGKGDIIKITETKLNNIKTQNNNTSSEHNIYVNISELGRGEREVVRQDTS